MLDIEFSVALSFTSEDDLGKGSVGPGSMADRPEVEGLVHDADVGEAGADTTEDLHEHVVQSIRDGDLVAPGQEHSQGDGRVEVTARDVAEGVDGDHEGGSDTVRTTSTVRENLEADRADEDVGTWWWIVSCFSCRPGI
jgi:hypothetical protein